MDYSRHHVKTLTNRLKEPRKFIQALLGPRQIGKTTAMHQVLNALGLPNHYASADAGMTPDSVWIENQWIEARRLARQQPGPVVLVMDEVQKIHQWSERVKREWDQDTAARRDIRVVLLGSSSTLVGEGLSESLAGRFEVIRMGHWQFAEMRDAFGLILEEYILQGGYPGGAGLASDPRRWRDYVRDSLIESVLSRDILMTTQVAKPALLRKLFYFACEYGGQALSYNKIMGQLVEAGHTATLAHYQHLLDQAWLIKGLPKWSGNSVRLRSSSPKWLPMNTALMTSAWNEPFASIRQDTRKWGRLVEVAVGGHLVSEVTSLGGELFWWREKNDEVDYVARVEGKVLAIEVKSGPKGQGAGLKAFAKAYPGSKGVLLGGDGLSLETFFTTPLIELIN
jgi:predicted AAA+ superfamily ATPase